VVRFNAKRFCVFDDESAVELFCIESTDSMLVFVVPRSLTIGKKHNEVIVGLMYGFIGIQQATSTGCDCKTQFSSKFSKHRSVWFILWVRCYSVT